MPLVCGLLALVRIVDFLDREVELVLVALAAAELGTAVGQHPRQPDAVLVVEPHHAVEDLGRGDRRFAVVARPLWSLLQLSLVRGCHRSISAFGFMKSLIGTYAKIALAKLYATCWRARPNYHRIETWQPAKLTMLGRHFFGLETWP
jgi:hypothetical protein